jgi:hypothetical protein
MDSRVDFQGLGPFSIGPAQSASARALPSMVQMTLNVIIGDDPQPRPIHVQMTHGVASKLAAALGAAATEIEMRDY